MLLERSRKGCEVTKNLSLSHYCFVGIFSVLTFLKRGIFTLVKNLFGTFSVLLRRLPPFLSIFFIFRLMSGNDWLHIS